MTIDLLAQMSVPVAKLVEREDGVYTRGEKKGQPKIVVEKIRVMEERTLIIDFKGNFFDKDSKGFFLSNKIQLQAAKLAVEQNFPEIKVDDVYNYAPTNWKTTPNYTLYKWDLTELDWKKFNNHLETAFLYGYNKPEGKMLITEGFKNSQDFKFLSYKEYVENVLMKEVK
jgi:hypothetical protein